jgi:hypothetical protein
LYRLGGGDPRRADRAAGAAHIHHDDFLAEAAPHRVRDQAGNDVTRASGSERHDQRHRAVGIVLCHGRDDGGEGGDGQAQSRECGADLFDGPFHGDVSFPCWQACAGQADSFACRASSSR